MKNLSMIIGKNLLSIRQKNNLSLDKVSKLTGVSKPMLGQIERGVTNPTVAILWKIATGLNVSFSYFIEANDNKIRYIPFEQIQPLYEHQDGMTVYPLFPYDDKRKFEIFTLHIAPGCTHVSAPHNESAEEYIIVSNGQLEVILEDNLYKLSKGDAIAFFSNIEHTYRNTSDETVCFQNIIFYFK